jgi:hypothetical protein
MGRPQRSGVYETDKPIGQTIYIYKNDTEHVQHAEYAHITAPGIIQCDVLVDELLVDRVWAGAGGSHSWWTGAGGRFLPSGLQPGQTVTVTLSGPGALRLDWYEQG